MFSNSVIHQLMKWRVDELVLFSKIFKSLKRIDLNFKSNQKLIMQYGCQAHKTVLYYQPHYHSNDKLEPQQ